jgi:DnaJ-domain-containing protein 1
MPSLPPPALQQPPPGLDPSAKAPGEAARKVHARELATNVVIALFRLVKLSTLHSMDNQAMVRQVEETVLHVNEYCVRTEHNLSILFTHGSVFVGGQLLRANRGVYEGALELGQILAKVGAAEIGIRREAKANDYTTFASVLADALRRPKPPRVERPTPNIRLRGIAASALREELGGERVDPNAQVARTYASAVVIMRRFFEELRRGKYDLPQRVKRVAQRLVDLSMGETPAFLGVTAARNQNHDEAGRAVNTAILALAMTRQVTQDIVQLSRIAMAALLHDCARARISGVVGMPSGGIVPQYSEQQENEAAAGTAVVLTALGRINEQSVMRTVISYEAHWERRRARLGPVYRGLRAATLQARILNIARTFNDLLTPAPGQEPPTADETIAKLEQEANDAADRTVIRLLIGALGIFTTGTIIRLNTGETGIVVQTPSHPSLYSQPRVRLVLDGRGAWIQPPLELDLAHQRTRPGEASRHIKEVVATSDDPAGAQMRVYAAGPAAVPARPQFNTNPPSGQSGQHASSPSWDNSASNPSHRVNPPSYQVNPPSYQINPPSYQINPPSYPVNPPSYQRTPPSYQVTPPSFRGGRQGDGSPASTPSQAPRTAPSQVASPPAPARGQHLAASSPLDAPLKPGRTTTLTTPVYGQPAQEPHPQSGQDAYAAHADPEQGWDDAAGAELEELPFDTNLDDLSLDDDEGGASTRAVSWEERQHILASMPGDDAASEPEPLAEPEPEPVPEEPEVSDDTPRGAPTAEGTLQKTPFVHLLIYMLDQRLSGTTLFTLASGGEHAVYFHDGTPAKVRTGTMLQPLDRVLVDEGMLDEVTLRGTLREISKKKILHGRLLVMKGLLDRQKVVHALRIQVLRKVTHLFELPGDTRYAYYKDQNLLSTYGGPELTPTEPLAVIMAGIRLMADDPLVDATLKKIAGRPLALHIDAEMKRMQLTREEQSVVDLLRARKATLDDLLEGGVAQPRVVRITVYALAVTRQLDLGGAKQPVGLGRPPVTEEAIQQPMPAPRAKPAASSAATPPVAPAPIAPRGSARTPPTAAPPSAQPVAPAAVAQPVQPRSAPAARPVSPASPARPASSAPIVAQAAPPQAPTRAPRPTVNPAFSEAPQGEPFAPPVPARPAQPAQAPPARSGRVAPTGPIGNEPSPPSSQQTPAPMSTRAQARAPIEVAFAPAPPPARRAAPPPRPTHAQQPPPGGSSGPAPFAPAFVGSPMPAGPIASGPIATGPTAPGPTFAATPVAPLAAPAKPELAARRADIEKRAQTIDGEDYYQMLGVTPEAPADQVKTAYFTLAKSWHPDRLPPDLLDVKPLVARVFARFSEAYQTLVDPAKSQEYAQLIKSGGGSPDDQEKVARVVDAAMEFQKAEILLKKHDLAGAEQLAAHAVQADPEQPEYIALLAWVRAMRRGDPPDLREGQTSSHFDDLIKLLDTVLAKEQRFERALYYRGVLLKRAGRIDKAIRDFRLAAEVNPKNIDAVREVRLYEMRKRGGGPPSGGAKDKPAEGQDGLFGKFFKR